MKNILLILTLGLYTITAVSQAPSQQYLAGMGKAMSLWGEGKGMEASALFERIAQAEKDNWLPSYYAANTLIVNSFMTKDKTAVNEMLEKAKVFIQQAHDRSPDNSEIVTMEGLLYTGYVAMDPETFGMSMSPKIMALHAKAVELDPTNPRAQGNLVDYEIGGARFFGTDLKTFCDRLKAVIPLYENQKTDYPFAPSYGLERVHESLKQCGCNEEEKAEEEKVVGESDKK